jgi:hypothetical protein
MTVEERTAPSAAEPLFTITRMSAAIPGPETSTDPWAHGDEPEMRLSLVETLVDRMGGPVIELGAAPVAFMPPPPATPGPRHRRRGMVRNFREWWRQESLARAAQKRAFSMAETILRSQAAQLSIGSIHRAPVPALQDRAVRGVLELTEERFQALGARSDRVQAELSAITRTLEEMRGQISELIALQRFNGAADRLPKR